MALEMLLNAFDALLILGVSVPSVVMASRITIPRLRTLSILLSSFFVMHGLYHLLGVLSQTYGIEVLDFLSDGLLEPFSYLLLLIFGIYLYRFGA
ncbi:MAG: hypothetical protein HY297_04635 [Thaumarchaeota archaeon]|nr:hypothetical protein [Nitrososphaerota archaeon]